MVDKVKNSHAHWVRLNFIVGPYASTDDPKFVSTYTKIIDAYRSKNIKVYGLVGSESVKSGYNRNNPAAFVPNWKAAVQSIVGRFKDKVKVWEFFNEPNDWAGGSSSQVTPYYFATFLQNAYEIKYYGGASWKNLTFVSGPLFSHDGDTGRQYIYDTYVAGTTQLAWDWYHQHAGSYPIDALGYHIYVAQGTTDAGTVKGKVKANLDAFWSGVTSGENYRGLEPNVKKEDVDF